MIITRAVAPAGQAKPSDHWRTPPVLFEALDREFAFRIDLAANAENHLVPVWFGPGSPVRDGEDALTASWSDFGHCAGFLNPPYSAALIGRFMDKAALEATRGFTSVVLAKYDPSTQWWNATRSAWEIREIQGRVPFLKADGTGAAGAMFPSCVVVFRPQPGIIRAQPRRVVWSYRQPKEGRP